MVSLTKICKIYEIMNKTDSFENIEANAEQIRLLSLAVITTLIVTVVTLYHLWQQTTDSWKYGMEMPGPKPLPLIGNAHMIVGKSNSGKCLFI